MAIVSVSTARDRRTPVSLNWLVTTSVPVALFVLFAANHVSNWRRTGQLTGALLVAQELVFVTLFLIRRRPLETSHEPLWPDPLRVVHL